MPAPSRLSLDPRVGCCGFPLAHGARYFRLHGIAGYRYRYTDADLRRLRAFCRGTTYAMFNNSAMAEDAARFQRLAPGACRTWPRRTPNE